MEKVAVLRLGRYRGLRGPGLVLITPILEKLSRFVDQRVRVSTVSAESTLTRDTVPVNVDAIILARLECRKGHPRGGRLYPGHRAQLPNRASRIHRSPPTRPKRETLGLELQKILDEKTTPWGITVQSVEIRDGRIPQSLENAMSQQAQAERERQARVILGDAEVQASEKFAEASRVYNENPGALHLRGMNMLYESMRDKGSMVIVPSSAIEVWVLAEPSQRLQPPNRHKAQNSNREQRGFIMRKIAIAIGCSLSFIAVPLVRKRVCTTKCRD